MEQIFEKNDTEKEFWNDTTKYTKKNEDSSYVSEIAYIMVTLHRTGA